eukprot:GHVQ01039959.1.p1 GENE.GHVQ01039959.1~~GHVQ01039959.1.p1  ORF type:complete len:446 (-),score=72.74 GHVQ01039959.1:219-1556(-)
MDSNVTSIPPPSEIPNNSTEFPSSSFGGLNASLHSTTVPATQLLSCGTEDDQPVEFVLWRQAYKKATNSTDAEPSNGLVIFVGKMQADEWIKAGVLQVPFSMNWDVLAISPPGIGRTFRPANDPDLSTRRTFEARPISVASFLKDVVTDCLQLGENILQKTVIVSHSNDISTRVVFPLLITEKLLGFILLDSHMGTSWMEAVDPILDDHFFYRPSTMNYKYLGGRRRRQRLLRGTVVEEKNLYHRNADRIDSQQLSPVRDRHGEYNATDISRHVKPLGTEEAAAVGQQYHSSRQLQQRLIDCRAVPLVDVVDDDVWRGQDLSKVGPMGYFEGRFQIDGWANVEAEIRERGSPDPTATPGEDFYVLNMEYFEPLKQSLREFLVELRNATHPSSDVLLSHGGDTPFRDNRREEFFDKKVNFETVRPESIYCISNRGRKLSTQIPVNN